MNKQVKVRIGMVRSYSEVGFAVPVELSKIPACQESLRPGCFLQGALRRVRLLRIKKIKEGGLGTYKM